MTIDMKRNGTELTLEIAGQMDAATSPQVDDAVKENLSGITRLIFDLEKVSYMTSAGLRVLVSAQKAMDRQGEMVVLHANEAVRDVFAMVGLLDIFNVQS